MPFTLADLVQVRPTLVHRTHVDNVPIIERTRELWAAAALFESAGGKVPARRRTSEQDLAIDCPSGRIRLNDQDPFVERYGCFTDGWTADELRQELHRHVFSFSMRRTVDALGNLDGGGVSELASAFFRKYASTSMLILVPTLDLFDANQVVPKFSCCNSGTLSARTYKHNIRGPRTFLSCEAFTGTASRVREVVFRGRVRLPRSMRIVNAWSDPSLLRSAR